MSSDYTKISKFLSLILRHQPDAVGLSLDENGWANIDELIEKANQSDQTTALNRTLIEEVVRTSDKQRFAISGDGMRIRANQGHSINIDLQLKPITPPEILYHGTAARFLDEILKKGLTPQKRQYVHLSQDVETAIRVGQRYGKPVALKIKARIMHEQGFVFYLSENGVWLTQIVPCQHIENMIDR